MLADDCQIFVVQTGLYDGANLRALAAERRMEQLAGQTGGAVYIPKTTTELDSAFQQIAADLAQQYVLSYYPGDERRDGRFHLIDLRVKIAQRCARASSQGILFSQGVRMLLSQLVDNGRSRQIQISERDSEILKF